MPLAAPAVVGSKPIVSVALLPAASVSGKLTPESVKPVPLTEPALTVTVPVPVPEEVKVTVWVAVAATLTVPKLTLVALKVSVGTVEAPG